MIQITKAQYNSLKKGIIKDNKQTWFFEHIKSHMYPDQKVFCKICNKDVEEIAEETFDGKLKGAIEILTPKSK